MGGCARSAGARQLDASGRQRRPGDAPLDRLGVGRRRRRCRGCGHAGRVRVVQYVAPEGGGQQPRALAGVRLAVRIQLVQQIRQGHAVADERDAEGVGVGGQVHQRQLDQVVALGDRHVLPADALPAPFHVGGADAGAGQRAVLDLLPGVFGALRDADADVHPARRVVAADGDAAADRLALVHLAHIASPTLERVAAGLVAKHRPIRVDRFAGCAQLDLAPLGVDAHDGCEANARNLRRRCRRHTGRLGRRRFYARGLLALCRSGSHRRPPIIRPASSSLNAQGATPSTRSPCVLRGQTWERAAPCSGSPPPMVLGRTRRHFEYRSDVL